MKEREARSGPGQSLKCVRDPADHRIGKLKVGQNTHRGGSRTSRRQVPRKFRGSRSDAGSQQPTCDGRRAISQTPAPRGPGEGAGAGQERRAKQGWAPGQCWPQPDPMGVLEDEIPLRAPPPPGGPLGRRLPAGQLHPLGHPPRGPGAPLAGRGALGVQKGIWGSGWGTQSGEGGQ